MVNGCLKSQRTGGHVRQNGANGSTAGTTRVRRCVTECRLLALSGHASRPSSCPLLGAKQTWSQSVVAAAFDPKRTLSVHYRSASQVQPLQSQQSFSNSAEHAYVHAGVMTSRLFYLARRVILRSELVATFRRSFRRRSEQLSLGLRRVHQASLAKITGDIGS